MQRVIIGGHDKIIVLLYIPRQSVHQTALRLFCQITCKNFDKNEILRLHVHACDLTVCQIPDLRSLTKVKVTSSVVRHFIIPV